MENFYSENYLEGGIMKNHALNHFGIYYALVLEPGVLVILQLLTMAYSTQKQNGLF